MENRDFEEKREFFRMRVDSPVQIQRANSAESFPAEGVDLSATGLSLIAEEKLSQGEILNISIKSQNPELSDFAAEAEVLRVVASEDQPNKFAVSVRFTAIY